MLFFFINNQIESSPRVILSLAFSHTLLGHYLCWFNFYSVNIYKWPTIRFTIKLNKIFDVHDSILKVFLMKNQLKFLKSLRIFSNYRMI